jgi:hypothetical protein
MRFPYITFPTRPDAAFPNRHSISRPILPILLQKNHRRIVSYALVDSGADNCIFPASLAAQLNITIPNQNAYVFSGTSDQPQLAYFETVQAVIWNGNTNESPLTFDLYAGFCETLEHAGLGLLGQSGFFSRYQIGFNRGANFFDIT